GAAAGTAAGVWWSRTGVPAAESRESVLQEVDADVAASPAKASGKSNHPPIAAIRDRMLQHYHGKAANIFVSIPGFGLERMTPLYKKIPFEIPSFSPGELEASAGPAKTPEALEDVFRQSLGTFQDPAKPLPNRRAEHRQYFPDSEKPGFGSHFLGAT